MLYINIKILLSSIQQNNWYWILFNVGLVVLGTKLANFRFNLFLGELWSFFWFSNFWAFSIKFSGFVWVKSADENWANNGCFSTFSDFEHFPSSCQGLPQKNLILCLIPDILGFGWVKSHEKWASYGWFSVFPNF